jgi:ribonuclease Z
LSIKDLIVLGTSSQQPTRHRNHGAYLFRWNNEGLLFDPGEGTQRQFIFANVAPTTVTRIFISHFHGDHCLGLGSMLMRLNLDKVPHPIHCYYPASGQRYFDRLRYGTAYHEHITVVEHPVEYPGGIACVDDTFTIEALFLDHGVENIGWRITEKDTRRFDKQKLSQNGILGPLVKTLEKEKELIINGETVRLEDVSSVKKGDSIAVIIDTRPCQEATQLAKDARLLLCESTYLYSDKELAQNHKHLTATEAAQIAKEAHAQQLILSHFSARYLDVKLFEDEARAIFKNSFAAHDLERFSFRDPRPSFAQFL